MMQSVSHAADLINQLCLIECIVLTFLELAQYRQIATATKPKAISIDGGPSYM
jgi:hypothetical protein